MILRRTKYELAIHHADTSQPNRIPFTYLDVARQAARRAMGSGALWVDIHRTDRLGRKSSVYHVERQTTQADRDLILARYAA